MTGVRHIDTRNADLYRLDQLNVEFIEQLDGYTRLMNGIDDELGHSVIEVVFDFAEELTAGMIADATAIIDAHVPGARDLKVLRYSDTTNYNVLEVPLELDYVNGLNMSLYRSIDEYDLDFPTMPKTITYYADADQDPETFEVTYDDAVVIERYTYVADDEDLIRTRTKVVSWLLESDAEHPTTKTMTTYYTEDDVVLPTEPPPG